MTQIKHYLLFQLRNPFDLIPLQQIFHSITFSLSHFDIMRILLKIHAVLLHKQIFFPAFNVKEQIQNEKKNLQANGESNTIQWSLISCSWSHLCAHLAVKELLAFSVCDKELH